MARQIGKFSKMQLYKFIPFKYVKNIIDNAKIPIKRIDSFEDCYENYFLKNKFVMGANELDLKKISRKFYGLCFSSLPESDAMWRIYSDVKGLSTGRADALDDVAIRVCVKPEQLYQMVPVRDEVKGGSCIQRVRYISKKELISELKTAAPYNENSLTDKIVESFFTKRSEFSHEKEVRYIFVTKHYHRDKTIKLSINPFAFFEEFTLDPRLTNNQCCSIKKELHDRGISMGKINQSDLYKFTSMTFQVHG